MITQFGWQVEKQFYNGGSGVAALTEAVVLVGGMEQGLVLPSLSWLVGVRTHAGTEFGVGPEHHAGRRGAGAGGRQDVSRRAS